MDKGIPEDPDRTGRTDLGDGTGSTDDIKGTKGAEGPDRAPADGAADAQDRAGDTEKPAEDAKDRADGRTEAADHADERTAAEGSRTEAAEDGPGGASDDAATAAADTGTATGSGTDTGTPAATASGTDTGTASATAPGTKTDIGTDTAAGDTGTGAGAATDAARARDSRPAAASSAQEPRGAALVAEGFGMKGPRGWVFRGVSLEAAPGDLVTLEGSSGSGRTCLLLALTGRMRPTEGHAEVAGLRLPRKMAAVRRISALGPVPGVSDLDPAFTVAEHLRERALLQRRFDASPLALLRPRAERAAASRARIEAALEAAGLEVEALPKGERTSVRDLERLEALRLSVALALIGAPRLLAVDDADLKLSGADRTEAWRMLRSIADGGTTVLAVCSEAPGNTITIRTTEEGTADALAETGRA
ncbi:ATP-binding cassette domain-containing protein [Streptomyces sp. NPDC051310]|uniref:ATP-binding cassette domain-containing protein n=1 Tax=Streptomyces sp. NPDC051310 TaxID=3365649 RepID=UPI00379037AF